MAGCLDVCRRSGLCKVVITDINDKIHDSGRNYLPEQLRNVILKWKKYSEIFFNYWRLPFLIAKQVV